MDTSADSDSPVPGCRSARQSLGESAERPSKRARTSSRSHDRPSKRARNATPAAEAAPPARRRRRQSQGTGAAAAEPMAPYSLRQYCKRRSKSAFLVSVNIPTRDLPANVQRRARAKAKQVVVRYEGINPPLL